MVPKNAIARMFARFGMIYWWNLENEQLIYNGFCNVIKGWIRDIMCEWKPEYKEKPKNAGHIIGDKEYRFDMICNFPLDLVDRAIWKKLCLGLNTEKLLEKSARGRDNHTKQGISGGVCRRTGGSIVVD